MKTFFTKLLEEALKPLCKISIAIGALALACFTASAQQPVAPKLYGLTNTTTFGITNGPFVVTTSASSNLNSVPFPIWRDRGFVFHLGVYTTNASGSNVNATLEFSTPHTNYGGAIVTNWENPVSLNYANSGTTELFISTNIDKRVIDNYTLGRLRSVTNNHLTSLFIDPTNSYITVIP